MSAVYYLLTTRPGLCVEFYTRILGLQHVSDVPNGKSPPAGNGASLADDASLQLPVTMRIDHRSILQVAEPQSKDVPELETWTPEKMLAGETARDLYFLVNYPLDHVHERIASSPWLDAQQKPLTRTGIMHTLRMMHLLDPDGNRIRLIELRR